MSEANKIVAAILTHGFMAGTGSRFDEKTWPETYKRMLAAVGGSENKTEPSGPNIEAAKAAIIETVDRVLGVK